MMSNIPFILYSSDGWDKNKVIGIVEEYDDTYCQVYLFLKNSEIIKEVNENGDIISFGLINADED